MDRFLRIDRGRHSGPRRHRRLSPGPVRRGAAELRAVLLRAGHDGHEDRPAALRRRQFDFRRAGRIPDAGPVDGPAADRLVQRFHVSGDHVSAEVDGRLVGDGHVPVCDCRGAVGLHDGLDRREGHSLCRASLASGERDPFHHDPGRLSQDPGGTQRAGRFVRIESVPGLRAAGADRHRLLRHGRSGGRRFRNEQPRPARRAAGRIGGYRARRAVRGRPAAAFRGGGACLASRSAGGTASTW